MVITKDTRVSDIFAEYGDMMEVMELFGIKRVKDNSLRVILAKGLTVEWAARFHRVPLDQFMDLLQQAISKKKEQSPS